MRKFLKGVGPYDLKAVVFSHGWSDLVPFYVTHEDGVVAIALRTSTGPVSARIRPSLGGVEVEASRLSSAAVQSLRWMLRLDDKLDEFYRTAQEAGRPWIEERKMGRLLRSQTLFEDVVKLVLTTNCSWSLTRLMTDRLSRHLGEKTLDGFFLFPTPEVLARKTEQFYRKTIRSGYRSPHLRTLGKLFAEGRVNAEHWKDPAVSTEIVRKEILALPGAGPYVADNLLRFLGRYDRLGLDSWARKKSKEILKMKTAPSDKRIEREYRRFGRYRGLVLWCDLTKDWFTSGDFKSWIRTQRPS